MARAPAVKRLVSENLAPRPWKLPVVLVAAAWPATMLAMLPVYRRVPGWVADVSLIYPEFCVILSILLDPQRHRRKPARSPQYDTV